MDSFDRKIEEYKRELMKYAKKNKNLCITHENSFQQQEEKQDIIKQSKYDKKFMCNRPMPAEYDGSENIIESAPVNSNAIRDFDRKPITEPVYKNYTDFLSQNTKTGRLRVQTYASTQVFPIQNARVIVEKDFEDGTHIFDEIFTDIDGVAENIILPTKDKNLSLSPGRIIPYSTYTVKVSHPQFKPIKFKNVPIFDTIESLQPVAMLPLNSPDTPTDVTEEEPDL